MQPVSSQQDFLTRPLFSGGGSGYITYGQILLLVAVSIPLFFVGLGVPPLLDADEPVYAATALTALHSESFAAWWSPHYNGSLWFDKPPLTYWLIGLSQAIFGANEFAARLPSALSAVAVVLLTAITASKLWRNSRVAPVLSGFVVATSFQTIILARAAVTDMILTSFLLASLLAVWVWLENENRADCLIWAGISTGLATLTKGPVAIVLVAGTILLYLLLTRQAKRILSPHLWLSLVIALAIALPWYWSMIHLHGTLFIDGFLESNNLNRYLKPEHPQTSSVLFFFPVLAGFIFPWTVPLVCAIAWSVKQARQRERADLFCVIWTAWVFCFFTLSQTKLITYIYPIYPFAGLMIGRWIDQMPGKGERFVCGIVFGIVALALVIALPGLVSHTNGLEAARGTLLEVTSVFALGLLSVIWSLTRKTPETGSLGVFIFPGLCMVVFFPLIALAPIWRSGVPDLSLKQMGTYIAETTPQDEPTVAFTLKRPSLVYYSGRKILFTDNADVASEYLIHHPSVDCVLKRKFLFPLVQRFPNHQFKLVSHSAKNYVLIRYAL